MLNISLKSVSAYIDRSKYQSFQSLEERSRSGQLGRILIVIFGLFILGMFLPWTQHIRTQGVVTSLNPYDKPQNIQALVGGRIDQWYVTEGDIVSVGDTILILTEAKEDYLDPHLLDNTREQQLAKVRSAEAHLAKRNLLQEQLATLDKLQQTKLEQLYIKQEQVRLEIETVSQELVAAQTYAENARNQLTRMQKMYDQGIKSMTDLETKRLANRDGEAKVLSLENKWAKLKNEGLNITQEIEWSISHFAQQSAKIESEIQSTDSYRYALLGESNKLQSKYNQLAQRQNAFVITSPIAGRITKVLKNGIGEYVKAQDDIATIVPLNYQKAVELYIQPIDMPLIREGKSVRIQFDGWPAIVFSGWPDNSFGTFSGKVYAIDNDISDNGKYRILVIEDDPQKPWPDLIRIGSGARGLLLLNEVKVYYEIWRQLNGFPPDFYNPEKSKTVKTKAPLRKVK